MSAFDITTASREDLVVALAELKRYRSLVAAAGKRGRSLFLQDTTRQVVRVELATGLARADALTWLQTHLPEVFASLEENTIVWKEVSTLQGGMRVFVGDTLHDFSYARLARRIAR